MAAILELDELPNEVSEMYVETLAQMPTVIFFDAKLQNLGIEVFLKLTKFLCNENHVDKYLNF